jgi:hypothetical protein
MQRAEWSRLGLEPAPPIDDARWLRRAYLDVVGTIPPPEVVASFTADRSADKRANMIDTLLASPAYVEHWTNYWDEELIGHQARGQDLDRPAFRRWLRARFTENATWDRIVVDLVTATGANGNGGPKNAVQKGGWFADDDEKDGPEVNGAINWQLLYPNSPQDLAGSASKTFLGVQIQCAQCHDHKTEAWTQGDFWSFAAAFARTRIQPLEEKQMGQIRRVEIVDLDRPAPRFKKNQDLAAVFDNKPRALDGRSLAGGKDVRRALAAWMTSKDNPYFARAFVNRMWGHFLGRGFTDPVNDMRASNPPTLEPLLTKLAQDFSSHGYDVKRLVRTITLTDAYQVAPGAPAKPDPENKTWSRFRVTPLGPEELLNAILQATHIEDAMQRAGYPNVDAFRFQLVRQYSFLFDVDENADSPSYEGTVSQALNLLNGSLVGLGSTAIPGTALADIVTAGGGTDAEVTKLYLRTLSRPPEKDELDVWTKYVASAQSAPPPPSPPPKKGDPLGRLGRKRPVAPSDPKRAALEDVFWALLNSSEFSFNH